MFLDVLTEKAEIFTSSLSISTNPSSELYSEESTEDVADVDSLYQQSAFSNPWPLNHAEKVTLRNDHKSSNRDKQ